MSTPGRDARAHVIREGLSDLEALKTKVMAPSVKQALKSKAAAKQYKESITLPEEEEDTSLRQKQKVEAVETKRERKKQAEGDRSGIKVSHSHLDHTSSHN